jgi:hypothetical protein
MITCNMYTMQWLKGSIIKENTESLIEASRDVNLEINAQKTKYMIMFVIRTQDKTST